MEGRERWQALQAQLGAARDFLAAGERTRAIAATEAALAIDPECLLAQSLRERILTGFESDAAPVFASLPPSGPAPGFPSGFWQGISAPAPSTSSGTPIREPVRSDPTPLVSVEGYARFEERARRRRIERRLEAARAAITDRQWAGAAGALEEVIELDPDLPELTELRNRIDSLRGSNGESHRSQWLAAAAAFLTVLFGPTLLQDAGTSGQDAGTSVHDAATSVQDAGTLASRSTVTATTLVAAPEREDLGSIVGVLPAPEAPQPLPARPMATSGMRREMSSDRIPLRAADRRADARADAPADARADRPADRSDDRADASPPIPVAGVRTGDPQAAVAAPTVASRPTPETGAPLRPLGAPTPIEPPAPPIAAKPPPTSANPLTAKAPAAAAVDDEALVKAALQRYRDAYAGLDARSARAVYPAVDGAALARAFDSLQSQSLTFDVCNVQLRGESAMATCRGSARYVPKVGNREPRTESRVWSFTLRKSGADWRIESLRAGR